MADTENHTLKLLQEMRKEMSTEFAYIRSRFESIDRRFEAVNARLDNLDQRMAGTTYMLSMLAGSISNH